MIPIAKPIIGEEEKRAVLEVLESGNFYQGEKVRRFEENFARYIGRKHGIAVSSGTAALHIALLAHGIGKGQEVVLPPLTFMSCASMVVFCGGKPVFSDVEEDTFNIDPVKIEKMIFQKTKAIMPVHLFGQPADMQPIMEIAEKKDLIVIEDACQAHGAEYRGKKAGSIGDISCFSFYPTKNMTTGEGGMILTDNEEIEEKCRLIRDHGALEKYQHRMLGFNYRMTEMAAAIGIEQLKKLDGFVKKRRENASFLTERIKEVEGLIPPLPKKDRIHSFYQYIVRIENNFPLRRDHFVNYLNSRGIGCRPSYPVPLYKQKALAGLNMREKCTVAEKVLPRMAELPVHPLVSREDLEYIVEVVGEIGRER